MTHFDICLVPIESTEIVLRSNDTPAAGILSLGTNDFLGQSTQQYRMRGNRN